MDNLEERPHYCDECRYIQFRDYLVCFDGDKQWYCTQAHLKVYRDEKACPWGLKKEKPKK